MVSGSGNTGRTVAATAGIEIPLTPRVLSDAEIEARIYRQSAAGDDPTSPLSRLRAELAGAQSTIGDLRARVQEQDAALTEAAAHVQEAVSRAELAEAQLADATERIEELIGELAVATTPPPEPRAVPAVTRADVPEPVQCAGGCGLKVAGEYVARTGRTWHGPCQDQVPAHLLPSPTAARPTVQAPAETAAPSVRRAAA